MISWLFLFSIFHTIFLLCLRQQSSSTLKTLKRRTEHMRTAIKLYHILSFRRNFTSYLAQGGRCLCYPIRSEVSHWTQGHTAASLHTDKALLWCLPLGAPRGQKSRHRIYNIQSSSSPSTHPSLFMSFPTVSSWMLVPTPPTPLRAFLSRLAKIILLYPLIETLVSFCSSSNVDSRLLVREIMILMQLPPRY